MFCIDLWEFFIDPLYLVYNYAMFFFKFQGPFRTQTELGFFWITIFLKQEHEKKKHTSGPTRPK
jgi:hypothetical protein